MFNDGTIHGGLEVADEATTPNLAVSVPNLSSTIRSKYRLGFCKYAEEFKEMICGQTCCDIK